MGNNILPSVFPRQIHQSHDGFTLQSDLFNAVEVEKRIYIFAKKSSRLYIELVV